MTNSYCVKCKTQTGTSGARLVTSANGRRMMKGECTSCGTNKSQFVSTGGVVVFPKRKAKKGKKSGAGFLDFLKTIF